MTLDGINWFAVALAVTSIMLYAHFRYIPRVEKFMLEKFGENEQREVRSRKAYIVLFAYSLILSVSVWNIFLIPQIDTYWLLMGSATLLFAFPRYITMQFKGGYGDLYKFESDRVFFEIASTYFIMLFAGP